MGILAEGANATQLFLPLFSEGVNSERKEFAPGPRSKFFPLRVDPISKSYIIQRGQQDFMHVKVTLCSKNRQGAFIIAGALLGLTLKVPNKNCSKRHFFYFYLSKKIRLDFSCESSA